MKTTLFLAALLLSLNSEGASAAKSAEDIAAIAAARREAKNAERRERRKANQKEINEKRRVWREANKEEINAKEKAWRAAAKLKSALFWHVGGKPLFEVEPLGSDKDVPVDQASFAFGAGEGAHLDFLNKKTAEAAARCEAKSAEQRKQRAANPGGRKKEFEKQKQQRAAAKLKSASSWHVGGKPLFEAEPLGSDEDVPVDQASFAFGAGEGAHLDKPAEGASADRSAEDIAAIAAARREAKNAKEKAWSKEKRNAKQREWRADPEIAAKIKAQKQAWRKANQAKINEYQAAWRAAHPEGRKKEFEKQKQQRDAAKLNRASSWHVGGKPEPLDLAGFAFGAGAGAHLDKPADKKRPRANGAKGGPATKPKTA